jgi:hypothetical protein
LELQCGTVIAIDAHETSERWVSDDEIAVEVNGHTGRLEKGYTIDRGDFGYNAITGRGSRVRVGLRRLRGAARDQHDGREADTLDPRFHRVPPFVVLAGLRAG